MGGSGVVEYWSSGVVKQQFQHNLNQTIGGIYAQVRDLAVYQKALSLTKIVRKQTASFPRTEIFGLGIQFSRAVDSIVLNLAEGSGNSSTKEFARFLDFSIRSGFECLGCCDIGLANEYLDKSAYDDLNEKFNEVIAMLHGLKKSLNL